MQCKLTDVNTKTQHFHKYTTQHFKMTHIPQCFKDINTENSWQYFCCAHFGTTGGWFHHGPPLGVGGVRPIWSSSTGDAGCVSLSNVTSPHMNVCICVGGFSRKFMQSLSRKERIMSTGERLSPEATEERVAVAMLLCV